MPKPLGHKRADEGGARRLILSAAEPAPTIMAGGVGSVNTGQYRLPEQAERESVANANGKPPYRVPLMSDINAIPFNGLTAVSTFSGCGGSSLGYRLAGFKVLWASEFIEAARDCYRANFPNTILDDRDIRDVHPDEILAVTGMRRGQIDLFDGSPPCSSFSTAGKRQEHWGKAKKYSDTVQRTDDLFFEYSRILRGLMPRAFVAENVSGLVKGAAKGYFLEILAELKSCGYRVKCKVLDAQWLGVPQCRQRCIFVGVREDLRDANGQPIEPAHPHPLPYRYSVREAIPWIAGIRHDSMGLEGSKEYNVDAEPLGTVRCPGGGANTRYEVTARLDVPSGGDYDKQTRKERSVDEPLPTVIATPQGRMTPEIVLEEKMHGETRHYDQEAPHPSIRAMKAGGVHVIGHKGSDFTHNMRSLDEPAGTEPSQQQGRHHHELLFQQPEIVLGGDANPNKDGNSFPRNERIGINQPCPTVMSTTGIIGSAPHRLDNAGEPPVEPESDISAYAIGEEHAKMNAPGAGSGVEQSDRYFQLVKAAPAEPSPTITAEGGNPSIASVVHPVQRRKFSIAELRRISSFPDDFILTGSYAQQWERIGRAVPPVMMQHIAEAVRDQVLLKAVASEWMEPERDIFDD